MAEQMEEGSARLTEERSSLLPEAMAAIPINSRVFQRAVLCRLAVFGGMLLAFLAVLAREHTLDHSRSMTIIGTHDLEQKFYDSNGAYWQAPNRGISTSEFWGGCKQANLKTCGNFCCCNEGFYWQSPKSVYREGETILEEDAIAAGHEADHMSVSVAEADFSQAAKDVGKAALKALVSQEQRCVPVDSVPKDVQKALDDSGAILESDVWMSCSTFTSHTHACGERCCCDAGFKWSSMEEACFSTAAPTISPGKRVLESVLNRVAPS